MNENIRNALEVLKRETLKVLYEQHINGIQYLRIKEVRELLGIPPSPGRHPNDMVCHFLLHLKSDGYAAHTKRSVANHTTRHIAHCRLSLTFFNPRDAFS